MKTKTFTYTNNLGLRKQLVVDMEINNEGKYSVNLFGPHGDWCGSGEMTEKELNDYLAHYGIKERIA